MAQTMRFRLTEKDRVEYGGEEWVSLNLDHVNDMRGRELERIERETGLPIRVITNSLNGDWSAAGVRALVWLARYRSGLRTPFKDFDIHTLQVDVVVDTDEEGAPDVPLSDSQSTSGTSG